MCRNGSKNNTGGLRQIQNSSSDQESKSFRPRRICGQRLRRRVRSYFYWQPLSLGIRTTTVEAQSGAGRPSGAPSQGCHFSLGNATVWPLIGTIFHFHFLDARLHSPLLPRKKSPPPFNSQQACVPSRPSHFSCPSRPSLHETKSRN